MLDWEGIRRDWERQRQEYAKLRAEPCMKTPQAGGRVLVAAGLLGRGFEWIREEAVVVEVAATACKVQFAGEEKHEWVENTLITDVLDG